MNSVEAKLGQYSDRELAFLYKFQLESYLPKTKLKIKNFIHVDRGLSEQNIEQLVAHDSFYTYDQNKPHCPRCKSHKFITQNMSESSTTVAQKITCEVCGYVLFDPEDDSKNIFGHVLDIIPDA